MLPRWRVRTSSQWVAATERKVPARSLWERQTRSMKGESDGRVLEDQEHRVDALR
jgi:hypothetical protein